MANYTLSPEMLLPIPTVGTDPGPDWANNINAALTLIDQHDHTPGKGNPITPAAMSITSDLSMGGNNLTQIRTTRFNVQPSALSDSADVGCLYVLGVDLYYRDGSGNNVRITAGGGVNGASGTITGLVSPASATFVSGDATFVWQSDVNVAASTDTRNVILRNATASSKGLTLSPPAAMASNYAITLPTLPASTKFLSMDSAGNISAAWAVDASTLEISSNTLQVKAGGITSTQLASSLSIAGNFTVGTTLAVGGNINASNNLYVANGGVIQLFSLTPAAGPQLSATNSSTFAMSGSLTLVGNVTVGTTLNVSGNTFSANNAYYTGLIQVGSITPGSGPQLSATGATAARLTGSLSTTLDTFVGGRAYIGSATATTLGLAAYSTNSLGVYDGSVSQPVVVSAGAPASGMVIMRGSVNSAGTTLVGEGFSSSRSSAGVYVITFSTAFAATPVVIPVLTNPTDQNDYIGQSSVGTGAATITTSASGAATDKAFSFIIIGRR